MKKILLILFVSLLNISFAQSADIDGKTRPEPLSETEFEFPDYYAMTMENGLKVFLIEDHEQPVIVFNMMFAGGSSADGDKSGKAELLAALMTKGSGNYTALEIARKLDGVGAGLNVNAGSDAFTISGSSLKKHSGLLFDILKEVLYRPAFPDDELDKLKKQMLSSLQYEKSQPGVIASKMARKAVYGPEHPYAKSATAESVESIEADDIKAMYKKFFVPNNASIALIGDFERDEAIKILNEIFGEWPKGTWPRISMPETDPMPLGVYFISRPGSVQSTIHITMPSVPINDENYELLEMAANVMSGGFGSRMFRIVREKYSYTYTPFGSLTSSKYATRFYCGAAVKNAVTDSAITVIHNLLLDLAKNPVPKDELNRVKKFEIGTYKLNFESSAFVSSLIQNADFYDIPMNLVKSYAERAMKFSPRQIHRATERYMDPKSAYTIVVGAPEMEEKLNKFGKVYTYDLDLKPAGTNKIEKISMDTEDFIDEYIDGLGGEDAIEKIKTISVSGSAKLMITGGQELPGIIREMRKAPNKAYSLQDFGALKQEDWVDGVNSWQKAMGTMKKHEGLKLQETLFEAGILPLTKLPQKGFETEVKGRSGDMILFRMVTPTKGEKTYYFDRESNLIKKVEVVNNTSQGPMATTVWFEEYGDFGGVKFPVKIKMVNPRFTVVSEVTYEINPEIDDAVFSPGSEK